MGVKKNNGIDDYYDVAPEGRRIKKARDTKELREVKKARRLAQASLDLSYAMEDIAKKNKLRGWEAVQLLQEMAFKAVHVVINSEDKRARAKRKSARA
jgi:hypothetical protein